MTAEPFAVVITRAAAEHASIRALLADAGYSPISYPCIRYVPLRDTTTEPCQIAGTETPVTFYVTSQHAVDAWRVRSNTDPVVPTDSPIRVICVGAASAERYRTLWARDPHECWSDLETCLRHHQPPPGLRVWLTSPDSAIHTFPADWAVQRAEIYCAISSSGGEPLAPHIAAGTPLCVCVLSGSVVRAFLQRAQSEGIAMDTLRQTSFVALGGHAHRALADVQCTVVTTIADPTPATLLAAVAAARHHRKTHAYS